MLHRRLLMTAGGIAKRLSWRVKRLFSAREGYTLKVDMERIKDIAALKITAYAEIGCNLGNTAYEVAKILPQGARVYLFDYDRYVEKAGKKMDGEFDGKIEFFYYGNSSKKRDSYCWSIIKLLKEHNGPIFDYIYIDGSHDLTIDGFAFFLLDKLLKVGGHIEFDDYSWRFKDAPTVNPRVFPEVTEWYTDEQLSVSHIQIIVDILVKRDARYKEIKEKRLFQKIG